jgi:LmbE family N-acetylglucosaminyl deacetylase
MDPMREWNQALDGELERVVVLSPHFDDAVMGCGLLLTTHPGATVVTVLGGPPPAYPDEPGEWDALGGFRAGDDVVARRREEDRAALAELGATPVWLDYSEYTYLLVEQAIVHADPTAVLFPFGLGNPDHVTTHDAARIVYERNADRWTWLCYEDAGYKHIPGMLAWRISQLFRARIWPTPAIVRVSPDDTKKRSAMDRYVSQLPPLNRDHGLQVRLEAHTPEQYWRLAPPPVGWEGLAEH